MNEKMSRFFDNLVPFLMLGITIAVIAGLLIMFSYILIWGFCIGVIIWITSLIKDYFSTANSSKNILKKHKGRIIEHKNDH